MRLIDADKLIEHKFVSIDCYLKSNVDNGFPRYKQGWNDAIDAIIDNAPTVDTYTEDDVQEAIKAGYQVGYELPKAKFERPQGEWIDHSEDDGYVECPFCGCATNCEGNIDELHYCWNCGAKMQKGGRE